jgi:glycosyltransferase involved in cell wall biosynthesis
MKVAVVTPYYTESDSILDRCCESVNRQTYQCQHILVADGKPKSNIRSTVEHIVLPTSHNDAGATPRAIGAISAFSRGYDAVAFLDADNTYQSTHIEIMVGLMLTAHADVISATRNICDMDGKLLYIDTIESTGKDFCDTNCLFLGKRVINLLSYWITDKERRLWSDRQFWSAITQSEYQKQHSSTPTVNYYSKWAWHYQHAGKIPPADSVWISVSDTGSLIHTTHINSISKKG